MDFPLDLTNVKIETERLVLQTFTMEDADDMFEYASVPGVGEMAGWPHHTNISTTKMVLSSFLENKDVFAIWHKADGKVIGSLGLHRAWINKDEQYQHLRAKNIGYVLAKNYWGQGLVPEAVEAVIRWGFDTAGIEAFSIEHFVENMQSRRVIEKCGFEFVREGRYYAQLLNKWFDELRYVLVK